MYMVINKALSTWGRGGGGVGGTTQHTLDNKNHYCMTSYCMQFILQVLGSNVQFNDRLNKHLQVGEKGYFSLHLCVLLQPMVLVLSGL